MQYRVVSSVHPAMLLSEARISASVDTDAGSGGFVDLLEHETASIAAEIREIKVVATLAVRSFLFIFASPMMLK
jgi:hypothetical protein